MEEMSEAEARRLFDEDDGSSIYTTTGSVANTWDDFLSRYTIEVEPDCTLKLRHRLKTLIVGIDITHSLSTKSNSGGALVKPAHPSRWWRRLRLDTDGTLTLRSQQINKWFLSLDMHGCINPLKRTAGYYWNVALDPWNPLAGKVKNKQIFQLGEKGEGRVHWKVDYCMPEMHGSIEKYNNTTNTNRGGGQMVERDVHTDVGYAHASIPRLELVFWPLNKPPGVGVNMREGNGAIDDNVDHDHHGVGVPSRGKDDDGLKNFSKPLE